MFSSLTIYLQWNTKKSLHYRENCHYYGLSNLLARPKPKVSDPFFSKSNNEIFGNFPFSAAYKIFIIQIETVKIAHIIILYNINT